MKKAEKLNIVFMKGTFRREYSLERNCMVSAAMMSVNGLCHICIMTARDYFRIDERAVKTIRGILKHDRESGYAPQTEPGKGSHA